MSSRALRPGRAFAVALLTAGVVPSTATAQSFDPSGVTDTFGSLYPTRAKTFVKASADPDERPQSLSLGNDDGFSGINDVEAYRASPGGSPVAVLAHVQGRSGFLGCFFRNFWSDSFGVSISPAEDNRTQMLVDGGVAHDRPLTQYFRRPTDPGGQIPPFDGPFTNHRSGAWLTHTPISWNDEFVVRVFRNAALNEARFHKVAGTLDAPEAAATRPDMTEWTEAYLANGWPHTTPRVPQARSLFLAPDGGTRTLRLTGPAVLLELTATLANHDEWRDVWVTITFDGRDTPSVDVPLRMLGGMLEPPWSRPYSTIFYRNDGLNRISCWFPMPFRDAAELTFENRGPRRVKLDLEWALGIGQHPEPWGYFTATWQRSVTALGQLFRGPKFENCRGMLRALVLESGMDLTGRIPPILDAKHLEGDLVMRLNGNRGDDHTFAATETSVGKWGWYLTPADQQFSEDTSFNTGILSRVLTGGVPATNRMQGSIYVFDPVHFVDGIDIQLEHGVRNASNADYGLLSVFYLRDGAARERLLTVDVGDVASEQAVSAQFSQVRRYSLTSGFFRDDLIGAPPLTDDVREIAGFYRFRVDVPQDERVRPYEAFALGFRLDRPRIGDGGVVQATVLVDGQPAGLLHSWTSNAFYRWKEGGEVEVELPLAATQGKSSFVVEIRPVTNSLPLQIGEIAVHAYTQL